MTGNDFTALDPRALGACCQSLDRLSEARYLECRLGADQAQVDYLFALTRAAAPVGYVALIEAAAQAPAEEGAVWTPVLRLLRRWADGRSPLSLHCSTFWLELDDMGKLQRPPTTPCISFCIAPNYRCDQPLRRANPARQLSLIDDLLEVLAVELGSSETGAPTRSLLSDCFDQLPALGQWIHVSVMLGRTPRAVKLYGVIPRQQLLPYLRSVGFQGSEAAVQCLLQDLYPAELLGDQLFIDLNLATFRQARSASVGLAVAQQHLVSGSDPDASRARILERWQQAGLCTAESRRPLHDWLCPSGKADTSPRARNRRFLDLKLVWEASTGVIAKAYLGWHGAAGPQQEPAWLRTG